MSCVTYFLFFFFQAEDGIRDYKVTGVQTCALPIFYRDVNRNSAVNPGEAIAGARVSLTDDRGARIVFTTNGTGEFRIPRSEERRVGKECRSRWSPYH